MAEIRTPDVDDLLSVLAALDDPDAIFALLEDLFTVREIRETSQRLGVARLLAAGKSYAAIEAETGASATTAPAATSKRSKFWMRARSGCAETGAR